MSTSMTISPVDAWNCIKCLGEQVQNAGNALGAKFSTDAFRSALLDRCPIYCKGIGPSVDAWPDFLSKNFTATMYSCPKELVCISATVRGQLKAYPLDATFGGWALLTSIAALSAYVIYRRCSRSA